MQSGQSVSRRARRWPSLLVLAIGVAAAATFLPARSAHAASNPPTGNAAVAAGYDLLGYLPPSVQRTCSLGEPSDDPVIHRVESQIVGEVYCYPEDGVSITYVRLSSLSSLEQLYDSYVHPAVFHPRLFDPAASCEFQGTWSSDGHEAGREACYQAPTSATDRTVDLAWEYRPAAIFALAQRPDGNADSLRSTWSNAGPIIHVTPTFKVASPSANTQANASLLARFPAQVRNHSTCNGVNVQSPAAAGIEYDWRLWVTGTVDCRAKGNSLHVADVTYDQWTDSTALAAYLRFLGSVDLPNGPTPANQASGCIAADYSQLGQVAGSYLCDSLRGDTTNHTKNLIAVVFWSNTQLKIGAFAARGDNDTQALMQWWGGSGSGPLVPNTPQPSPATTPLPTGTPPSTPTSTAPNSPAGQKCPPICF
jgi:hypothetical protein